jgi:hypothetical protein
LLNSRKYCFVFRLLASLAAFACISAGVARADDRTTFLIDRMKAEDFRVRTNAALALGATNDEAAVPPLCAGLSDTNEAVRQAAAAGLKRLAKASSVPCMRARVGAETNDSVKLQLTRALAAVEASAPAAPPAGAGVSPLDAPPLSAPNAKIYVSISPVANNSARPQAEVDRVIVGAMRAKLEALGTVQIAPRAETAEAARAVVARRKLKGYYLAVSVDKFDYEAGTLKVKVKVAVFTYPGKDLRGEVPAGAAQAGVRAGDRGSEDNLMSASASRAAELFAQNFK